jgi:hypothetical protein
MLVPWLAIGFGCGILIYFNIDQEPALWATIVLFATTVAATVLSGIVPLDFPSRLVSRSLLPDSWPPR